MDTSRTERTAVGTEALAIIQQRWPTVWEQLLLGQMVGLSRTATGDLLLAGQRLASGVDRGHEAALQAERIPGASRQAWVYGPGLGDLPRHLLQRPQLEALHVVLFHPTLFREIVHHSDCRDWLTDPRTHLLLASDTAPVHEPFAVSPVCLTMGQTGDSLRARVGLELATPYINRDFLNNPALQQRVRENQHFLRHDGDVASLFNTQAGKTILVAGSGPTLFGQREWIKQHQGASSLIAVASALIPLSRMGLCPDYVVTIDPFPILHALFDLDLSPYRQTPLIYFPVSDPAVLDGWPGPRYAAYSHSPFYAALAMEQPRGALFSAGSVLHTAVDLAVAMGAATCVLLGCDLAFPSGATHALGFPDLPTTNALPGQLTTPDGYGRPVQTAPSFNHFRLDLEAYIARHPQVGFVNGSRLGAHIAGCSYRENSPATLEKDDSVMAPGENLDAKTLYQNAEDHATACRLPEAEADFNAALIVFTRQNDRVGQALARQGLAELLTRKGALDKAAPHINAALELIATLSDRSCEAEVRRSAGEWSMACNKMIEAAQHLEQSKAIVNALDNPRQESRLCRVIARFYARHGHWDEALRQLQTALELCGEDALAAAWCFMELGAVALRQGDPHEARHAFDQANQWFMSGNAPRGAAMARNQRFLLELQPELTAVNTDCLHLIQQTGKAFRQGLAAQGNTSMAQVMDCLTNALRRPGSPLTPTALAPILKELLAAQARADVLEVADLLEFRIAPLLFMPTSTKPLAIPPDSQV